MSLRILVVDDAEFMRKMLGEILSEGGFEVVGEAADGETAIEEYRRLRPDVVTMDIVMPGMGGIAALRVIREFDPQAVVIICSALGQEKIFIEALQAGASEYIVKPFDEDRIVRTIERIVEKSRQQ